MRLINFTRINGKYIADNNGFEITSDMLIKNEHNIDGDYGWIKLKDELMKYYCITATINHKRNHFIIKAHTSYLAVKILGTFVNADEVTRLVIREANPLNIEDSLSNNL